MDRQPGRYKEWPCPLCSGREGLRDTQRVEDAIWDLYHTLTRTRSIMGTMTEAWRKAWLTFLEARNESVSSIPTKAD